MDTFVAPDEVLFSIFTALSRMESPNLFVWAEQLFFLVATLLLHLNPDYQWGPSWKAIFSRLAPFYDVSHGSTSSSALSLFYGFAMVYQLLIFLALAVVIFAVKKGYHARRSLTVLRMLLELYCPILVVQFGAIALRVAACSSSDLPANLADERCWDGSGGVSIVFAFMYLILLFITSALTAVLFYPSLPSASSVRSQVSGLGNVIEVLSLLVILVMRAFEHTTIPMQTGVGVLYALIQLGYTLSRFPYYRPLQNAFSCGKHAAVLLVCVSGIVAKVMNDADSGNILAWVAVCGSLPAFLAGACLCTVLYNKSLTAVVPSDVDYAQDQETGLHAHGKPQSPVGASSQDSSHSAASVGYTLSSLEDPLFVDVLVRKFTQKFWSPLPADDNTFEHVSQVFEDAMLRFPADTRLTVAYAYHVLALTHNCTFGSVLLRKAAANCEGSWFQRYQCFRVAAFEREVRRRTMDVNSEIGSDLERALAVANAIVSDIRSQLCMFWKTLLHEEPEDLTLDAVIAMDSAYRKVQGIFAVLLRRYSRSSAVLRAYAAFLQDIENDSEGAEHYNQIADELECARRAPAKQYAVPVMRVSVADQSSPPFRKESSVDGLSVYSETASQSTGASSLRAKRRVMPAPLPNERSEDSLSKSSEKSSMMKTGGAKRPSHMWHLAKEAVSVQKSNDSAAGYGAQNGDTASVRTSETSADSKRSKVKLYRQRIESSGSSAIRLAILCVAILLITCIVFVSFAYAYTAITLAKTTAIVSGSTIYGGQTIGTTSVSLSSAYLTAPSSTNVVSTASSLQSTMLALTADSSSSLPDLSFPWFRTELSLSQFANSTIPSNRTLNLQLQAATRSLIEASRSAAVDDGRFLLYNTLNVVAPAFSALSFRYASVWADTVDSFNLGMQIAGICASSVLFLFIVFILLPAQRTMASERSAVLRLFGTVPKATLSSMYGNQKAGLAASSGLLAESGSEGHLPSSARGKTGNVHSSLIVRVALVVALAVLIGCVFFITAGVLSVPTQKSYGELYEFASVQYYTSRLAFWSQQLSTTSSSLLWTNTAVWDMVASDAANLNNHWQVLISGKNSGPRSFAGLSSSTSGSLYSAVVEGASSVDALVSRTVQLASRLAAGDSSVQASGLSTLLSLTQTTLPQATTSAWSLWEASYKEKSTMITLLNLMVFMMFWPVFVLLAMLVIVPALRTLHAQDRRIRLLLLLLPADVIENNAGIREYILSGDRVNNRRITQALKESEERTRSLLEASSDGIVEFDEAGILSVVNRTASRMFGYAAEDVLGKDVRLLLDDADGRKLDEFVTEVFKKPITTTCSRALELNGRRKDGSMFPVKFSVSSGAVGERRIFAGFLRDISIEKKHEELLVKEKKKSEALLSNIMPRHVADRLMRNEQIADYLPDVSIVFLDIVNFTTWSSKLSPTELIASLHRIFSKFDDCCATHRVHRIKLIGDCLFGIANLQGDDPLHAEHACDFGLACMAAMHQLNEAHGTNLEVRVGIHVGPIVAGVLGTRTLAYDAWSSSVNVASRMESSGLPSHIQISRSVYERVHDQFICVERGETQLKGVGKMLTYFVKGRNNEKHD